MRAATGQWGGFDEVADGDAKVVVGVEQAGGAVTMPGGRRLVGAERDVELVMTRRDWPWRRGWSSPCGSGRGSVMKPKVESTAGLTTVRLRWKRSATWVQ